MGKIEKLMLKMLHKHYDTLHNQPSFFLMNNKTRIKLEKEISLTYKMEIGRITSLIGVSVLTVEEFPDDRIQIV